MQMSGNFYSNNNIHNIHLLVIKILKEIICVLSKKPMPVSVYQYQLKDSSFVIIIFLIITFTLLWLYDLTTNSISYASLTHLKIILKCFSDYLQPKKTDYVACYCKIKSYLTCDLHETVSLEA